MTYHHSQTLRLKHLKPGELFNFTYDIKTPGFANRQGQYVEGVMVYPKEQTYIKVSPRKIQPVEAWLSGLTVNHKTTGKPSTLCAGQGDHPVTAARVINY